MEFGTLAMVLLAGVLLGMGLIWPFCCKLRKIKLSLQEQQVALESRHQEIADRSESVVQQLESAKALEEEHRTTQEELENLTRQTISSMRSTGP